MPNCTIHSSTSVRWFTFYFYSHQKRVHAHRVLWTIPFLCFSKLRTKDSTTYWIPFVHGTKQKRTVFDGDDLILVKTLAPRFLMYTYFPIVYYNIYVRLCTPLHTSVYLYTCSVLLHRWLLCATRMAFERRGTTTAKQKKTKRCIEIWNLK